MRCFGYAEKRGKTEHLNLTGKPSDWRERETGEKNTDGIVRETRERVIVCRLLQMTGDREVWWSMVANVCWNMAPR